jgi:SAM-dependent methyltransferase
MNSVPPLGGQSARERYTEERKRHWETLAKEFEGGARLGRYYHERLRAVYRNLNPPGQRVLELGCGTGDLLAACCPSFGVGVDFSREMIIRAAERNPDLVFVLADVHEFVPDTEFDVVILSDLINDLWDVQRVLTSAAAAMGSRSRLILNFYSRLWEPVLLTGARLGLAKPLLPQNWFALEEIRGLLGLAGLEVIRNWREVLWPLPGLGLGGLANKVLARFWPLNHLAVTNFILARPIPASEGAPADPLVSVVVPVRNEAGNIPSILQRTPELGAGTELVFVEGHSVDGSLEVLEREIGAHPERRSVLLRQPGVGKGDAVRHGFARASGQALLILDADLTVPPEDLGRFYQALVSGKGDLINGVRLTYPMGGKAMRFLNLIGNRVFSLLLSWMLGQPVKDTLCGTKALWKSDYERIAALRGEFGDFDPFGDFELILGAAKLNLKILDLPIRYQPRTYGRTNIQRWRHGWMLARTAWVAARKLFFT